MRYLILIICLTGCSLPLAKSSHVDELTIIVSEAQQNHLDLLMLLYNADNLPKEKILPVLIKGSEINSKALDLASRPSGLEIPMEAISGTFLSFLGPHGDMIGMALTGLMTVMGGTGLEMNRRKKKKSRNDSARKLRDAAPGEDAQRAYDESEFS